QAGEYQPHGGDAYLDNTAEAQMQRAVVTVQHVRKDRVGRMQQQRHAELLDPVVEWLKPFGIDARVRTNAAGKIGPDEPKLEDGVIEDFDRRASVNERDRRCTPEAPGIF